MTDKCKTCHVSKEQLKRLKELMKKRAKSKDCPYIKTCQKKVLKDEFVVYCKDKEVSQEIIQIHMAGKHTWEMCPEFIKEKRKREGKTPREWNT